MLNKTRYHFAGCVLVVATILFATGCSGSSVTEDAGQKAQATGWRFEFPRGFPTTDELQKYLGRESLGGQVNVQAPTVSYLRRHFRIRECKQAIFLFTERAIPT